MGSTWSSWRSRRCSSRLLGCVGGWVGGWVGGKIEENETVRMSYCMQRGGGGGG